MKPIVSFSLVVLASIACWLCVNTQDNTTSSFVLLTSFSTRSPKPNKRFQQKSSQPRNIKCDPYCCNCNGIKARCTGQDHRKFHYLPQLPARIRDFRMFRNNYYHLNRTMMSNLSNFELETMNLTNNNIHYIDNDTFADFPKIKVLDLSANPILIPELRASLSGMASASLSTLALGAMNFTSLPENFFDLFFNRTFRKVDLQQNNFETFDNALFQPFWRIDALNMAQNKITRVNMSVRVNIKELTLKENQLAEFPDLSLHQSQTEGDGACREAFYYLQVIAISGNPLRRINPQVLRRDCFPHLRRLDISLSTLLRTLENNFIAGLPELKVLMVNNMKTLDSYERYAFNSTSLRVLHLDGNRRFDKDTVVIPHMFKHCPNLQELSIADTKVEMDMREMWSFLVPLKSVQFLNLQRIRKGNIPPDLLWRLTNLTKLIFTGANLNSDSLRQALINVTTLKRLNVQANGITVVSESTLPWEFRRSVEWIDLSQNPFSCTCEMLWFRNWLDDVEKNKSITVNNFRSSQYRCRTPVDMLEVPLFKFRPTAESCAVKNPFIIVGIVGACFLMGLTMLLTLMYRYRWHLRYYVYRLRRRWEYVQVPGALMNEAGNEVQLFPYDAYLAHSPKDLDWVIAELLPIVEGEQRLKVFVEERDSMPGAVIVDNITKYMDESARVMLLISDNYNREGWRQCEFEHILFAAFEQHKDVIVLLLGDVEAGRMTKDMRRMLTRGTFLQWGPSEGAQRVFRNGLRIALKTQDISFQNMC